MELAAQDLVTELEARARAAKSRPVFLDKRFKAQSAFIKDKSRLKAALCTARAGKSYGVGLYLLKEAQENPGVSCLYLALTRDSAKKIMWKDIFKVIDAKLGLGAKFNETELSITLPNGSVVYLLGADSTDKEREKILGQKLKLVVVDEAASFTTDLHELVYKVLQLRVSDLRGTICLIGTPGNLTRGLFFDVTTGVEKGWSVHRWSALDNPYQREQHLETMAEIRANRPLETETPRFRQMYLGEWCVDDSKLIYRYRQDRNSFQALPIYPRGRWHHVLGVDLGHSPDPSAFVVLAYHDFDTVLYVLSAETKLEMDITAVAERIKALQKLYDFDVTVIDGANKQAVAEMQNRHELSLKPADKTGKADFQDLLSAELTQGKVKFLEAQCQPLIDELGGLIWNERSAKREENPNCANHAADAWLYGWRFTYTHLAQALTQGPNPGTPEYAKQQEEEMWAAEREALRRAQNPDEFFPDAPDMSWGWSDFQ